MSQDEAALVEAIESEAWSDMMRACPTELAQGLGLSAMGDGNGATLIAARLPVPLFNRSLGWHEAEAWRTALAAHRASGAPDFFLQPPPPLSATLAGWLRADELVHRGRWAKVIRDRSAPPAVRTDLRITDAGPAQAEAFATAALGGFGMPPVLAPWLMALSSRPGWRTYVAWDGDTPVASATLRIHGDHAWFGIAATVKDRRHRGGQSALFARRIADALDAGCTVLATETGEDTPDAPNPSFRNMLRAGFRVVYFRDNWGPPV